MEPEVSLLSSQKLITAPYTEPDKSSITNSMEQVPCWQANSYSASQEILCLLWDMKVH
jgi:hypothetical protein